MRGRAGTVGEGRGRSASHVSGTDGLTLVCTLSRFLVAPDFNSSWPQPHRSFDHPVYRSPPVRPIWPGLHRLVIRSSNREPTYGAGSWTKFASLAIRALSQHWQPFFWVWPGVSVVRPFAHRRDSYLCVETAAVLVCGGMIQNFDEAPKRLRDTRNASCAHKAHSS